MDAPKVEQQGEWWPALKFILDRAYRPFTRIVALWYFFVFVVVLGSAGVWASLIWLQWFSSGSKAELVLSLLLSVITYAMAVGSTGLMDMLLSNLDRQARILMFLVAMTLLLAAGGCLAVWRVHCVVGPSGELDFPWLWFAGTMAALWAMWWMANASDERFRLSADPRAAVGGDPLQEL